MTIEIHPFEDFVPPEIKYLLLGSFVAKDSVKGVDYDWYYSNGRNQFWPIIKEIYHVNIENKEDKISLFTDLRIGITDIFYKCHRREHNSLDNTLEVIEYNTRIPTIFKHNLEAVFFTSRFVEASFKKNFSNLFKLYPETKLLYLPSPSPRYATLPRAEKVKIYKKLLPSL